MEFTSAIDGVTGEIIRAAIEVHRRLGPGLLESTYEACLAFELTDRGLRAERQRPFPLLYRSIKLEPAYRVDLLVQESVIARSRPSSNCSPSTMLSFSLICALLVWRLAS